MPSHIRNIILCAAVALPLLVGCNRLDENVVATVYGHVLTREDVAQVVPQGVAAGDSAALVRNYINQWVDQMIMVEKAKKNIKDDFSAEMEQYRNSLLIYAYEGKIIEQNLDTNVSDAQVRNYYNEHPDDFVLMSPVVKVMYVKVRHDDPNLHEMIRLMDVKRVSEASLSRLNELASNSAIEMSLDADTWVPLSQLTNSVPSYVFTDPNFLTNNYFSRYADSTGVSLVHFVEHRLANDFAPVDVEHENIKTIILNRRKQEIVKQMRIDLRRRAEADGAVKMIE